MGSENTPRLPICISSETIWRGGWEQLPQASGSNL